jgi:peptidoglycan hydrolase CwlO-like protein
MYTKERPEEEKVAGHGTFYVPGLPIESLGKQTPLSQQDIDLLINARSHSLRLLKGAYENEKKLNAYLTSAQKQLELYESEIEFRGSHITQLDRQLSDAQKQLNAYELEIEMRGLHITQLEEQLSSTQQKLNSRE